MSAFSAMCRKMAMPSLFLRSSDIARLLRCRFWKSGSCRAEKSDGPLPSLPPSSRASILMTLAPQSANSRAQVGPARTRVRSSTKRSCKAVEAGRNGILFSRLTASCLDARDEILDQAIDLVRLFDIYRVPGPRQNFKTRTGKRLGKKLARLLAAFVLATEHDERRNAHRRDLLL